MQTPFLNPGPSQQWYGVENVARVRVNGERFMPLPPQWCADKHNHAKFHQDQFPRSRTSFDLVGGCFTCVGLGNTFTQPLGYMIIWVQVDGVQHYEKDKIVLVILDLSDFVVQVPVIL